MLKLLATAVSAAVLALTLLTPATAQSTDPFQKVFGPPKTDITAYAPSFLAQISVDQMQNIIDATRAQLGDYVASSGTPADATLTFSKGYARAKYSLDEAGKFASVQFYSIQNPGATALLTRLLTSGTAQTADFDPSFLALVPMTSIEGLIAQIKAQYGEFVAPPAGRVPIRTGIRRPNDLEGTWRKVREEAALGHRTFVVVPLIEEGTDQVAGAVAAGSEAVRLGALLEPLRVGMVHGRLKAAERDAEMARFRDGDLDVLVGTTVVEVGVDVPEATVMVIQGADRFGLAQLHQLRGRVGRGSVESFCVLVSDSADEIAQARLKVVAGTHDGFELAEKDFELRREGDVLGLAQSGFPRLRVASLQVAAHRQAAVRARTQAERLLDQDGRMDPPRPALSAELESGWLRSVADAEPASGT